MRGEVRDGLASTLLPGLMLRRDSGDGPKRDEAADFHTAVATARQREDRLCCRGCGAWICNGRDAREMDGRHSHHFTNPHGLSFEVRCFDTAAGLRLEGEATAEYSWFPGYHWCVAVCATCLGHLGWYFESADDSFYGIIGPRLISCTPDAPTPP